MKLRYFFVLLTILLVIGCTTKNTNTTPTTPEQTPAAETPSVQEQPSTPQATQPVVEEKPATSTDLGGDHIILIKGPKAVEPSELTVSVGSTVTWTNDDYMDRDTGTGRSHAIAEWNDYFRSGSLKPGDSFSFTFDKAGTYEYRSITTPGARGTIIVE